MTESGITTITSTALVFLTASLAYFTYMLWKSTRRLADATDAMAAATVKGSELAHGSRLTAKWDVAKTKGGMVRVCVQDRRSVPILLAAVYCGTSQDLTTKKTRNGEWPVIRLRRAQRWLYTVCRVFRRICGQNGGLVVPRQTHSVRVCSPPSRRVAPPPLRGATAWTPAPRTRVPALVVLLKEVWVG